STRATAKRTRRGPLDGAGDVVTGLVVGPCCPCWDRSSGRSSVRFADEGSSVLVGSALRAAPAAEPAAFLRRSVIDGPFAEPSEPEPAPAATPLAERVPSSAVRTPPWPPAEPGGRLGAMEGGCGAWLLIGLPG